MKGDAASRPLVLGRLQPHIDQGCRHLASRPLQGTYRRLVEGALEGLLDTGEGLLEEAKDTFLFFFVLLFLLFLIVLLILFDEPAMVLVLSNIVLVVPCILESWLGLLDVHRVVDFDKGPWLGLLGLSGRGLDSEVL